MLFSRRVWENVKIYLCVFHVLKNWKEKCKKRVPGDKFAKWEVFWEMQQVLYLNIEFGEREVDFIERTKNAMEKIFTEYNVPAIKKYFEKHYAKIYGKFFQRFDLTI